MSTKFTIPPVANVIDPPHGPEVQLPLGQLLVNAHQWITQSLIQKMQQRGHENLTSAHLTFLSHLDCGVTHASAVARRMRITRQGVYRSTRELQNLGILELKTDPNDKRQKIISMTKLGEKVALDARAALAEIEAELGNRIGHKDLARLSKILTLDWGEATNAPQ